MHQRRLAVQSVVQAHTRIAVASGLYAVNGALERIALLRLAREHSGLRTVIVTVHEERLRVHVRSQSQQNICSATGHNVESGVLRQLAGVVKDNLLGVGIGDGQRSGIAEQVSGVGIHRSGSGIAGK